MKNAFYLLPLFLGVFFLFGGNGLFISSAGIELSKTNTSEILIGLINTSFFLGASFGCVFANGFLSKIGHIRTFAFFGALIVFASLAHTFLGVWFWVFLRFFMGFAYYSMLTVIESWLNEQSASSQRAQTLSIYMLVFYSAYLLGVFLLRLELSSTHIFTLGAMFIVLSMMPILFTKIQAPQIIEQKTARFPKVFKVVPLALFGSFVSGIFTGGFLSMASVFVLSLGFSADFVSSFMLVSIFGGLVAQVPMGKFSDKVGRKIAIIISSSLSLVASLGLVFITQKELLLLTGFMLGLGIFTLYSLSLARANDVINEQLNTTEVARSLLLVNGVGAFLSPLVIGILILFFGAIGFSLLFAVFSFLVLIVAISQDRVKKDNLSIYVGVPADATTYVQELDPR